MQCCTPVWISVASISTSTCSTQRVRRSTWARRGGAMFRRPPLPDDELHRVRPHVRRPPVDPPHALRGNPDSVWPAPEADDGGRFRPFLQRIPGVSRRARPTGSLRGSGGRRPFGIGRVSSYRVRAVRMGTISALVNDVHSRPKPTAVARIVLPAIRSAWRRRSSECTGSVHVVVGDGDGGRRWLGAVLVYCAAGKAVGNLYVDGDGHGEWRGGERAT